MLVFLNRKSEKGPLICRTCKTTSYTDDPSVCPNCSSADVKFQKYNLQTLSEDLKSKVKTNLVFATQEIFFQDKSSFDLIYVLSADTYLSAGRFDGSEKTFQLVTSLLRLVAPQGQIIIQTAHPTHPGIKYALQGNYAGFYRLELKDRQDTTYPPYSNLAKLTFAKKDAAPPEINDTTQLEVFGPFPGRYPYFVLRYQPGVDLSGFSRPWKLDLDPLSL